MSEQRAPKRARTACFDMSNLVQTLGEALDAGDETLKRALQHKLFHTGEHSSATVKSRLVDPAITSELFRVLESSSAEDALLRNALYTAMERPTGVKGTGRPRCFQCDGCLSLQHGETVFKCAVCPQFILCRACEESERHPHPMLCISSSTKLPRFVSATVPNAHSECATGAPVVHPETVCDGCAGAPIWGPRFKCCVCDNFELCEHCVGRNHPMHDGTHVFLKIRTPWMAPDSLAVEVDDD
eukprot:TRINITY_DN2721_c0_g1_i1.p1 TRINITY_DN2721_c0_g1~~TRINITY_DN2721_c0_g1_i1.p1  ORF type:complete len:242 (+),score=36.81 TRINITY_DN2721_c0_g1_i1:124-849(+)